MALLVLGILVVGFAFYWIFTHSSSPSSLIVQMPNESQIEALRGYLEAQGIKTFAKNMFSQGLAVRKFDESSQPSLHVIDSSDLSRAIELAKEFLGHKEP